MVVIKRDGTRVPFEEDKIKLATMLAGSRVHEIPKEEVLRSIFCEIKSTEKEEITIPEIQAIVEKNLEMFQPKIATTYIKYRKGRDFARRRSSDKNKDQLDRIVHVKKDNFVNENANMAASTPAGQMMKFASLASTDYASLHLVPEKYLKMHDEGFIHIHDLDYYACKTRTCVQYDLKEILEGGFWSKDTGFISEPQRIETYAELAAIVFQTEQNLDHGGQSTPAFDFFMAPGVIKSYNNYLTDYLKKFFSYEGERTSISSIAYTKEDVVMIARLVGSTPQELEKYFEFSYQDTVKATEQAMQGFIHNMNMMHSRGGNQVVFSSINYGTDTSPEGRLVMKSILDATDKGVGTSGRTAIFPIQIYKMKDGESFSYKDYELWRTKKFAGESLEGITWSAPNFDIFLRACEVSSKRLFPNFLNLDVEFNTHELWRKDDPSRWMYEPATMGCRTRVFENVNGEKTTVGRGNLSFTTINLPRLAIETNITGGTLVDFLDKVKTNSAEVCEQLMARLKFQMTADPSQFPFTLINNVWKQEGYDDYADSLRAGTLGVGFIGLHNAMMALFGAGHADNRDVYDFSIKTIETMNEVVNHYKESHKLNFSVLATPAEGLSGRFTKLDKEAYGVIEDVNDREYYVNSFHIDVAKPISAYEKIDLEAPFHALCKGGHISYIELDGEAKKNIVAYIDLVIYMMKAGLGYVSVNHPVDTCRSCGTHTIIHDKCPVCTSDDISRIRRITGYLTGEVEDWNSYKQAEERDRVKHSLIQE